MNVILLIFAVAPTQAYALQSVKIHDGDTVIAEARLPRGIRLEPQSYRAANYDAWEVNRVRQTVTVTDEELKKGAAARDALIDLLKSGSLYAEDSLQMHDNYGRALVKLYVKQTSGEWVDVAEFMKAGGHVRK